MAIEKTSIASYVVPGALNVFAAHSAYSQARDEGDPISTSVGKAAIDFTYTEMLGNKLAPLTSGLNKGGAFIGKGIGKGAGHIVNYGVGEIAGKGIKSKYGAKIVSGAGKAGGFVTGAIASSLPYLGIAAAQGLISIGINTGAGTGREHRDAINGRGYIGSGKLNLTSAAYTMRQRGLQSISNSANSLQQTFGEEARTYYRSTVGE